MRRTLPSCVHRAVSSHVSRAGSRVLAGALVPARLLFTLPALSARILYLPLLLACQFWLAAVVHAGDFTMNLGATPNWPNGGTGPVNFTMTDQYGFRLNGTATINRIGGVAVSGYPDETNIFGTSNSIGLVWDANSGSSGVGESTNTATLSFSSGGSPFAVDALSFIVSDIDPTDNNDAADRCDFVTLTGDAGNPALSYVSGNASTRSVRIGPATGSGSTGALAANQAQCIYNLGTTTSNTSTADSNGSVLAVWPSGTTTASVLYDESIENVYGVSSRDAAGRGIGIWSAMAISVDQSITLSKTTSTVDYAGSGEIISYTYVVTNTGRLPINTSQDIVIDDDKIGQFVCGSITSDIPVGGTVTCTNSYLTTAGDATASGVTNIATAGVGTPGQSFATRLQSNSDSVTVPRDLTAPSFAFAKSADKASVSTAGETITYTITATNTGPVDLTGVSLSDNLIQSGNSLTLTTGPILSSGDSDSDGVLDTGESWTYTATYDVTQAVLDDGNDIVNLATLTTAEAGSASDTALTSTPGPVFTCSGDNFSSANAISGVSGTTVCSNAGATGESGEPTTYGGGQLNTIWYVWTAPSSGTITFDTCSGDTNFDTTLKAFTGSSVSALTQVATNDDASGCGTRSRISFSATAGTTYHVQVDGYTDATGDFRLSWNMTTPQASITKTVDKSTAASTEKLTYSIIVDNTGTVDLTGPVLNDEINQNGTTYTATTGPILVSGDSDGDGVLDTDEVWIYTAAYDISQANLDDGNDLINTATFDADQISPVSDTATTSLNVSPALTVTKSASDTTDVTVGQVITYTYTITNTGNQTISAIKLSDAHDGSGPAPAPDPDTAMLTDNAPTGDSTNPTTSDGEWDALAPGDVLTVTATYTVTQTDVDTLQ